MDVRLVSATNSDLTAARASGRFRDDLYYRLAEIHVVLPPLRDRGDDVSILFKALLEREAAGFSRDTPEWGADVETALKGHSWPGNVRELRHCLRRALLLCGRRLEAADLGLKAAPQATGGPVSPLEPRLKAAVSEMEAVLIQRALVQARWVRQDAAALLEVDVKTLYNKMKAHGLA
jgi:DNA-binding NtrC family response regulator